MSRERPREPEREMSQAEARSRNARRFQVGVQGLIVAVACCGVVTWAARTLWESQHPAMAAARELQSGNLTHREGAARNLGTLGIAEAGVSVPALIAALGDREAQVRIAAIEALAVIAREGAGNGSAVDAVRTAIAGIIGSLSDREPAVQLAAIYALVSITPIKATTGTVDPQAVADAFAATLGDRDEQVRLAALNGLSRCGRLGSLKPPAALAAALEGESAEFRAAAITALATFPCSLDPWLPFLLRTVEQDEPKVRSACWQTFARMQPPAFSADAIPRLVAALGSRSRIVRSHAARALYVHASDRRAAVAIPIPPLLALLREPIDPELFRQVVQDPLLPWEGWDPSDVAADVLGQLAPDTKSAGEIIAALTEVVRSEHPSRRASAANALGEFGAAAEPAVPALIQALREGFATKDGVSYSFGDSAARALGRIAPGTKSADDALAALTDALDPRPEVRHPTRLRAVEALLAFKERAASAIPRLRVLQKGSDPQLRFAVEKAMKAIEGP
jgi:HEAT repeat protein